MYLYVHRCQDEASFAVGIHMKKNDSYSDYLARFCNLVGEAEVGQLRQYKGKFVRKLNETEFLAVTNRYHELLDGFSASVTRAETVDETVILDIRKSELELLLSSAMFP